MQNSENIYEVLSRARKRIRRGLFLIHKEYIISLECDYTTALNLTVTRNEHIDLLRSQFRRIDELRAALSAMITKSSFNLRAA